VAEEKSQRIAEVMLGFVKPFEFMLGKLLGSVCLSLTGASVYIIAGLLSLHSMDLGTYIPYHLLPWFLVYMVMAIFMFGALFAAVSSAFNTSAETQSVMMPVMLPIVLPFVFQMPVITQPQSAFATGMSLFPIFTPFLMLARQGTPGGIPFWQPCLGLIGVFLTTLVFVWLGSRVFRIGILTQGTPPRLGNILRWALRG
jgi:ABC-2 type transport system permease protein